MKILDTQIEQAIRNQILVPLSQRHYELALEGVSRILDSLYTNIPNSRRSSYGRVHTIKVLSKHLFVQLSENVESTFDIASNLFEISLDHCSRGVALGILSHYGLEDYLRVLPYFTKAACSNQWEIREFAQMFFRKMIRKHPEAMKSYLLKLVKSQDANARRFVSETLRPVQENRWFYDTPQYSLSILRFLFRETHPYPRTSVGNNLSDLAKRHPDLVLELVQELVSSGDKDAYWIAYRACRNLVKIAPVKVMTVLGINEYRYKQRVHKRSDSQPTTKMS